MNTASMLSSHVAGCLNATLIKWPPKKIPNIFLLLVAVFLFEGCRCSLDALTPDARYFNKVVAAPALRDSLKNNALTEGMPIFVADQVFRNCKIDSNVAVASVGSRQPLYEKEGLFFHSHDPNIKVYLNTYRTVKGTLCVWYQYPDFYRMTTMAKDSVFIYWDGGSAKSRIKNLLKPTQLALDSDASAPDDSTTVEIRSREQSGQTSYWYAVAFPKKDVLKLNAPVKDVYPIMHIELDGNPVSSFRWR